MTGFSSTGSANRSRASIAFRWSSIRRRTPAPPVTSPSTAQTSASAAEIDTSGVCGSDLGSQSSARRGSGTARARGATPRWVQGVDGVAQTGRQEERTPAAAGHIEANRLASATGAPDLILPRAAASTGNTSQRVRDSACPVPTPSAGPRVVTAPVRRCKRCVLLDLVLSGAKRTYVGALRNGRR